MSALICSRARPVRKGEAPQTNGISPPLARPAETPTMFCSAMPTLIRRLGNSALKAPRLLEPTLSLHTATMRRSARASSISVSAKAWRQSKVGAAVLSGAPMSGELLQRERHLLGRGHLVVPLDAVLDEGDALALDGVGDHAARPAVLRPGEGLVERVMVVAVELDRLPA